MLDIVHFVHARGRGGVHRGLCPSVYEWHHKWQIGRRTIGGGDFEIEVVLEIRYAAVGGGLGCAGGICPAERGPDRAGAIPLKSLREGFCGIVQRALDHLGRGETGFVGEYDIGRGLHIDVAPAVFVVWARVADIAGGMDEEALEHAGAGACARKLALVELGEERGGPSRAGRGHAGATVGAIVGGITRGDGGVEIHAIGDQVGLDAAVVARAEAGERGDGTL